MVARLPESDAVMPGRIFTSRAYQLADDPEVEAGEDAVDAVAGIAEDPPDAPLHEPLQDELSHRRRHAVPPSLRREGDGAEQRRLGLPRVEPRVLHDDGHVGLDDAGVVGRERDGLRVAQVVEGQVVRRAGTVTR
jgi:hypothetical protein